MTNDSPRSDDSELQFDRVDGAAAASGGDTIAVTCTVCQNAVTQAYYSVNGAPVCAQCKDMALTAESDGLRKRRLPKAVIFGLLAAIAGAILYYAVIAITDFEIGIVAIACGYMVGWAVHRAVGGFGGRRYQVLAAALTYLSVGLAYTPLAIKGAMEGKNEAVADSTKLGNTAKSDSTLAGIAEEMSTASGVAIPTNARTGDTVGDTLISRVTATSAQPDSASAGGGPLALLLGIGVMLLFPLALPVIAVLGSMPSGLISALIIAIGMRQAWQMVGHTALAVAGPFAVGSGAAGA